LGLLDGNAADAACLRGAVSAVEPLGAETLVVGDLSDGAGAIRSA
jgi:hypothetical protein